MRAILKITARKVFNLHSRTSLFLNNEYMRLIVNEFGKNVKIYSIPKVYYPNRLSIGDNTTINHGVVIGSKGSVKIGSNVRISNNVVIHTGYLNVGSNKRHHYFKPVVIGDNVWIATGAIILAGVSIGENSIIAAGSVVTKRVPSNSICKGVPAKCESICE